MFMFYVAKVLFNATYRNGQNCPSHRQFCKVLLYLNMQRIYMLLMAMLLALPEINAGTQSKYHFGLTLLPSGVVSDKVDVDARIGIVNESNIVQSYRIDVVLNGRSHDVFHGTVSLSPGDNTMIRCSIKAGVVRIGRNSVRATLVPICSKYGGANEIGKKSVVVKDFEVVEKEDRSTRLIEGAWAGLYHWSEQEGKHWNQDIAKLTDNQWAQEVRSMHKIGMDFVVVQEVFRNQAYVGSFNDNGSGSNGLDCRNYAGKAFFPSKIYPGRMPISAKDPLEAILSQADKDNMDVMLGVGMFAWFDFGEASLEWHENVAKELWERYGGHPSFYGFYVSEECCGNLFNSETTQNGRQIKKNEIVTFFKKFRKYVSTFAPEKPIMLATNSMGIMDGADTYPELLSNLDILCPFGFARMPEGDLTGKQAADTLQKWCDAAGTHLWFDLEAFKFNSDMSLSPRPIEEITEDLNLFGNFEKVLCYQFPGVFNDPSNPFRVGEESSVQLFKSYLQYYNKE
jgi:hypothetical protein